MEVPLLLAVRLPTRYDEFILEYEFPGTTIHEKHLQHFRITETTYAAHSVLPEHVHQTAYLSFLLAGGYRETQGTCDACCTAGTVIWHPPYDTHSDCFGPAGGHMLNLEVSSQWLAETSQEFKTCGEIRAFQRGLPYSLGLRLYRAIQTTCSDVDDVALELAAFFFSEGVVDCRPPAWFQQSLELVADTYTQPQSLACVACAVGVHPVHVARSFRRFLGCTFGDHVAKLRVAKAFELLAKSNCSIVDVAHACGFADHAHLCRAFKTCTGFTPSAFRSHLGIG